MDLVCQAAARFVPQGAAQAITPLEGGHVHDTYLVTPAKAAAGPLLLQRVNTRVFPRPEEVMHNIRVFCAHAQKQLPSLLETGRRPWEIPQIVLDVSGSDLWRGPDGSCWRAFRFIGGAKAPKAVTTAGQAFEVGYALGMFHRLLDGLPAEDLFDTLKGFHQTPLYLQRFDHILAAYEGEKTPELLWALAFVRQRRALAWILEEAKEAGRLKVRPIHGDPKVNNVLLDTDTGQAISLVDWDTIKPGLRPHDLGDCLRSAANPLGEDTDGWRMVRFRPDLARWVWEGYLRLAAPIIQEDDRAFFYEALRLIPFELGIRFLTDFLEGNVYFKVDRPFRNLHRALVQFRLVESIEEEEAEIRALFQVRSR